ncbi:hypothetical protein TNCV_3707731 [Trichonephila clavipes]|nr:hypothetical protein TNCV_3707731 [Trichonephila clavipes]
MCSSVVDIRLGKTMPLPGRSIFGSIGVNSTSSWHAPTHHGLQQGRQCAGHLVKNQARRLPGVNPGHSATALGRGSNG